MRLIIGSAIAVFVAGFSVSVRAADLPGNVCDLIGTTRMAENQVSLIACLPTSPLDASPIWKPMAPVYGLANGNLGIGTANPISALQIRAPLAGVKDALIANGFHSGALDIGNPTCNYTDDACGAVISFSDKNNYRTGYIGDGTGGRKELELVSDYGPIAFYANGLANSYKANLFIGDNGNVGVGTTSPSFPFHVYSANGLIANFASSCPNRTWFGISNTSGTSSSGALILGGPSTVATNNWEIGNDLGENGGNNLYIYDRSAGTPRMFFDSSGNVGIGTIAPSHRLDVRGGGAFFDNFYTPVNASIGYVGIGGDKGDFWFDSTDNNAFYWTYRNTDPNGVFIFWGMNGASRIASFYNNGNVGVAGSLSAQNVSDARLKKKVKPLEAGEGLKALEKLRPVSFAWANPALHEAGEEVGFIAQDVQKAFPAWVKEVDVFDKDKALVKDGKALAIEQFPGGFNALLVRAIQDLKAANDSQAEEIKALRARLDAFEARVQ